LSLFISDFAVFPTSPHSVIDTIYNKNYTRPYYYALPACYTGKIRDQQKNVPLDNLIIRIYNISDQQLVGEGITKDGYYFIAVGTDDTSTQEMEGAPDNSGITAKIFKDGTEYQLYTDSLGTLTSITHESGHNKEIHLWMKGSVLGMDKDYMTSEITGFQSYPNPFSSFTTIRYEVQENTKINLSIYNYLGQEIKKLVDNVHQPGIYEINWDGTDNGNRVVPGGIYICQIRTNGFLHKMKVLFMR